MPENLHPGLEVKVARYMSQITSDGEKPCSECIDGGRGPAVAFCCECLEFLCSYCHEYHRRSKKFHQHQTIGLDKESVKQLPSVMKGNAYICNQPHHGQEKLEYYCKICCSLICRNCTAILHKDHTIVAVCSIAKAHRNQMRETLTRTSGVLEVSECH